MRLQPRKNIIYLVVALISILLVLNIILTGINNNIISENRKVQEEIEKIRIYYDQIGKSVIHSIDIGLRGYAIVKTPKFGQPLRTGMHWMDSIFTNVEKPLKALDYNFEEYNIFKDSLISYANYSARLMDLLDEGKDEEFKTSFAEDRGAHLWWMYLQVESHIGNFIDQLDKRAQAKYESALFRNQLLQILLFIICVPTLIYTAIRSARIINLSEMLREAQDERNKILLEQNVILERKINERVQEITAQNEEIIAQSEELAAHRDALAIQNKQLYEAQKTIELQHQEIQQMNEQLRTDVGKRTEELREANKHLLEQNNQLEQFAFIAAHNLRAPLTRIMGLANLIQISHTEDDKQIAMEKLVASTHDLDFVIRDLNTILNIRRQTSNLTLVNLRDTLERVKRFLEKEIEDTHAVIADNFSEAESVYAVGPYIESILYNLISNAIKYRAPERMPFILLETHIEDEYICLSITDNGLGIDLSKHKHNVFNLYKRFHLHMEGRGLGLYLVRTQVEAMGGKIDIKSQPNEGSTFLVYFKRFLV
ncbi:sensor histidine kinase [Chryseosolibacter indicus]|uniref:histidine kinase n=1 Tax=Chryseosolibacter indicus TaxID=2782351 RepID=A0ABS5VUM7_9BACT|nr:ATP-binding protein [Chryseosolibacter indicus]MBT1704594.1 hypothetical protein [Chryseosolibacter indicus]